MYFLDQPEEIIIEQIRYLPLQDLMSVCQTNPDISRICSRRRLWDLRLMDEFGARHPTDPRTHYLLLDARRSLLNYILHSIPVEDYNANQQAFSDYFTDYQDFTNTQTNKVNSLSMDEIQRFNITQRTLDKALFLHEDGGLSDVLMLFFTSDPIPDLIFV